MSSVGGVLRPDREVLRREGVRRNGDDLESLSDTWGN